MYIIDLFKRLIKLKNLGITVYLLLNLTLISFIFSNGFENVGGIFLGILLYLISLTIALSPIGEWLLRFQLKCKKLRRKEHKERLEPLFEEVYNEAKKINPNLNNKIKLFINNESSPAAFATGRKTICLTKGLLNLSDEEIKAIFAHEIGHLSNHDTDLILLITVGNLIITTILTILSIIMFILSIAMSEETDNSSGISGLLSTVFIVGFMWIWTKIGELLVLHTVNSNEYDADKFAVQCGYGKDLISALDKLDNVKHSGIWSNLKSSHPNSDDRIGTLQEMGL